MVPLTPDLLGSIHRFVDSFTPRYQEIGDETASAHGGGRTFEGYCRDMLAGGLALQNHERTLLRDSVYAYEGNVNSPPDAMFRGGNDGPAFEFKKVQRDPTSIQLNSSNPEATLRSSNRRISNAARQCEEWTERELFYVVGAVSGGIVNRLWVVQGRLYAADGARYEALADALSFGLESLGTEAGVQVAPTNELSRLHRVDPLDRTQLRIRGMWLLDGPRVVFNNVRGVDPATSADFLLHVIIESSLWSASRYSTELRVLARLAAGLTVHESVEIADPNEAGASLSATVVRFEPR